MEKSRCKKYETQFQAWNIVAWEDVAYCGYALKNVFIIMSVNMLYLTDIQWKDLN